MTAIRIELQLADGSFTSGLLRAGQSMASFRKELARLDPHYRALAAAGDDTVKSIRRVDGAQRSLLSRMRDITVVAGGAAMALRGIMGSSNGIIGSIVRLNAEMEKLRFQLAGLSTESTTKGAFAEAAEQVQWLQKQAKSAPFSLQQLTNTMVKLKVAGLDPMNGSMRALVDGVAAFGGSDENLHRITLGITQMSGKGVIQMEELRQQLGESMPEAMRLMARSMGVSIGELTRAIASGRVEARAALSKWFDQVDLSFGGSADQMMQTFSGQIARLKTAFTQRVTEGEMSEAFNGLKKMIGDMVSALESPAAAEFFDNLGESMQSALELIREIVDQVGKLRQFGEKKLPLVDVTVVESITKLLPIALGLTTVMAVGGRLGMVVRNIVLSFKEMTTSAKAAGAAARLAVSTSYQREQRQAALAAMSANRGATNSAGQQTSPGFIAARDRLERVKEAERASAAKKTGSALLKVGTGLLTIGRFTASAFLPMLAIGTIALPLAISVGKAIWNWATGAKEAGKNIKDAASEAKRIRENGFQQELDTQEGDQRGQMIEAEEDRRRALEEFERRRVAAARTIAMNEGRSEGARVDASRAAQSELEAIASERESFEEAHTERVTQIMWDGEQARTAIVRSQAEAREQVRQDEIDAQVAKSMANVMDQTQGARRSYNSNNAEIEKEYAERMAAEQRAGRTGARAREWYQEEIKKADKEITEARITALKGEIELAQKAVDSNAMDQEVVTKLLATLNQYTAKLQEIDQRKFQIDLLTAPESEEKKLERLTRYLDGADEKVRDLSAELNGASGAVGKLIFQIKRGDFGNLEDGTDEAERLRYMLVEATLAAEALDDMLKDGNKPIDALSSSLDGMNDEIIRLQAINSGAISENDPNFDTKLLLYKAERGLAGFGQTAEQKVLTAIENVIGKTGNAIELFNEVGNVLSTRAFSDENTAKINTMADAIRGVATAATGLVPALAGLSGLGGKMSSVAGLPSGFSKLAQSEKGQAILKGLQDRGMPEHIAQGFLMNFQDESGLNTGAVEGKPNVHGTRGFGLAQWTDERRDGLEAEAARRGVAADDLDLQLDYLMSELEGDERARWALIKEATDAREAAALIVQKFLRPAKEHEAERTARYLTTPQDVLDNMRPDTVAAMNAGAEGQVETEAGLVGQNAAALEELRPLQDQNALDKSLRELNQRLQAAVRDGQNIEDKNATDARDELIATIESGGLIFDRTDASDPIYKDLLAKADEIDQLRERTEEQREAARELAKQDEKALESQIQATERLAETQARLADPNYRADSKDLERFDKETRDYLDAVEKRYGRESEEYAAAQKKMSATRRQIQMADANEIMAERREQNLEIERNLMTEAESRRADHKEAIDELKRERDFAIQSGVDKTAAYTLYHQSRKLMDEEFSRNSQTALSKQVRDMGDLNEGLRGAAASWPQEISNAIYEGDWSDVGDKMREGISRSFADKASSILMKPFINMLEGPDGEGGLFGIASSLVDGITDGISKKAASAGGGKGLLNMLFDGIGSFFGFGGTGTVKAGTAHSGAILGSGFGGATNVSPSVWSGAPRFHTGGIIGGASLGLKRNEVPLIGLKGEGVFTEDQMSKLGGTMVNNRAVSLSPTINVNASGGTPEQNADLANQIGASTEKAMRGLVREEMQRQMRPGAMLGRR